MVEKVTVEELRGYVGLPASVGSDQLEPACDAAYLIVTEDLSASGYSDERLDQINLNLAAHFATVSVERGGLTYQRIGQSEERYQLINSEGYGLGTTRFGQIVILLDTLNLLAGMSAKPLKAEFEVITPCTGRSWSDPC